MKAPETRGQRATLIGRRTRDLSTDTETLDVSRFGRFGFYSRRSLCGVGGLEGFCSPGVAACSNSQECTGLRSEAH